MSIIHAAVQRGVLQQQQPLRPPPPRYLPLISWTSPRRWMRSCPAVVSWRGPSCRRPQTRPCPGTKRDTREGMRGACETARRKAYHCKTYALFLISSLSAWFFWKPQTHPFLVWGITDQHRKEDGAIHKRRVWRRLQFEGLIGLDHAFFIQRTLVSRPHASRDVSHAPLLYPKTLVPRIRDPTWMIP